MKQETRNCQNCKQPFVIEPEDFAFYEKMKVPPPTFCPECRMVRRMMFFNWRILFKKKDAVGGQEIFSSFPPSAPMRVYAPEYWRSDAWDALAYGRSYNFSRSFFDQFRELLSEVPVFARSVVGIINSDYSDQSGWLKNCYLCFCADTTENSAYLLRADRVKDSFDLYDASFTELSYEDGTVRESYRAFFSVDCEQCTDVWFSRDLVGCANCFGCVNLRKKSYYIFNQPQSKDEYAAKIASFRLDSYAALTEMHKKVYAFWQGFPIKYFHGFRAIASSGEFLQNVKNTHHAYSVPDSENITYSQIGWRNATDAYDCTNFGLAASQLYECVTVGIEGSGSKSCWECWNSVRDLEYCAFSDGSSHCFGCVGLRKKSYCIFNKQYSREDYFALREKIIRQMNEMPYTDTRGSIYRYGEFFPSEFSPFAYNETIAQDFFPLTKETAQAKGFLWRDPEAREYQTTIDAKDLSDRIGDVQDSILNEIIKCAGCDKAYRIIQMELAFLRRMSLPLPRLCPNCRHTERLKLRNPPRFYPRTCRCAGQGSANDAYQNLTSHFHGASACVNKFETSYAPDRKEIIYCESCYNKEAV